MEPHQKLFEDLTPEQDQIVTQLIYNCILLNDFLMSVIAEMRTPLEHSSLCKGHIKQEYQRLMKAEDSYRGRIKNALQDMDNKYFFCDVADAWIGKLGKRPEYLLGAIRNGLRDAGVPQYDVRAHVFRVSLISQMAYGQYLINMQDIGKVKAVFPRLLEWLNPSKILLHANRLTESCGIVRYTYDRTKVNNWLESLSKRMTRGKLIVESIQENDTYDKE